MMQPPYRPRFLPRTAARLLLAAALLFAALAPAPARAGAQLYEPLADSVREALSAIVADAPVAPERIRRDPLAARWIDAQSERLVRRVPDPAEREELLATVYYESARAGHVEHLPDAADVRRHHRTPRRHRFGERDRLLLQAMGSPHALQVDGDVGQLCLASAEDRPVAVAAADATVTLHEGRLERAGVPLLARGEVAEVGEDGTRGSVGGSDRAGDLHGEPSLDKGLTCGQTSAYLLDKG